MNRWLMAVVVCGAAVLSLPAHAVKPAAPVSVEIVPTEAVVAGRECGFKITVVSQLAAQELVLRIHPVGGVKWSQGERRWSGPVEKGVPVIMEFRVIAPQQGAFELHAIATVQGKKGGGFGARAVYSYADPAAPKAAPQERKAIRHGKEIIEVPVR